MNRTRLFRIIGILLVLTPLLGVYEYIQSGIQILCGIAILVLVSSLKEAAPKKVVSQKGRASEPSLYAYTKPPQADIVTGEEK